MIKRFYALLALLLMMGSAIAQTANTDTHVAAVPMADNFRQEGKIYVVITVMTMVFVGILAYLVVLERKVKKLEDRLNEK